MVARSSLVGYSGSLLRLVLSSVSTRLGFKRFDRDLPLAPASWTEDLPVWDG